MNKPNEKSVATPAGRKAVLFLDDSPEYLEVLDRVMGVWSREEWEIHTAVNAAEALRLLDERPIDIIVIDLHMPVVDGAQFLQMVQQSHPGVRKVILTGYSDSDLRTQCLSYGAELFLEKPRTTSGLEIVYQTLRQCLASPRREGFRGLLRSVSLTDIIQMECLNRSSTVLEISAGSRRGRIYVARGDIVHAEVGDQSGVDAFRTLMFLKGGDFTLLPFTAPARQTIGGSWENLLLEVAQSLDELGAASSAPAPAGGGTTGTWLRRKQLEENSGARAACGPARSLASTPGPSNRASRCWGKSRITEILAYDAHGPVLQSLGCPAEAERRRFLDQIAADAQVIAPALNLGDGLSLEASAGLRRWVVRWEGARTTFAAAEYDPNPASP